MNLNLDWLTTRPVSVVKPRSAYIVIPEFNQDVTVLTGSQIVLQYNYSAPEPFTLVDWPRTMPDNTHYPFLACIRYRYGGDIVWVGGSPRTGSQVFRYKLWPVPTHKDSEPIGDSLVAPVYNGERIEANFCIEIWNLTGNVGGPAEVVKNNAEIHLTTSIRSNPSYPYSSLGNYALSDGTAAILPSTNGLNMPLTFDSTSPAGSNEEP